MIMELSLKWAWKSEWEVVLYEVVQLVWNWKGSKIECTIEVTRADGLDEFDHVEKKKKIENERMECGDILKGKEKCSTKEDRFWGFE